MSNGATQETKNLKRKRHQVKLACVPCRKRHAGCDETRPCKQCVKHGTESQCVDMPRRKRRASVDIGAIKHSFVQQAVQHPILNNSTSSRRAFSVDYSALNTNHGPSIVVSPPSDILMSEAYEKTDHPIIIPKNTNPDKRPLNKSWSPRSKKIPKSKIQRAVEFSKYPDDANNHTITVPKQFIKESLDYNHITQSHLQTLMKEIEAIKFDLLHQQQQTIRLQGQLLVLRENLRIQQQQQIGEISDEIPTEGELEDTDIDPHTPFNTLPLSSQTTQGNYAYRPPYSPRQTVKLSRIDENPQINFFDNWDNIDMNPVDEYSQYSDKTVSGNNVNL